MPPAWLSSIIFFSIFGLLVGSQLFWFWRARRLLHSRPQTWLRWLLGVPVYAWFLGLFGMFLLALVRWALLADAPVLLSLFMQLRRPVVMVPVGLWVSASLLSFLLVVVVRGTGWVWRWARCRAQREASADEVVAERRYFLQAATYTAGALPFAMVGYGFLVGRQRYRVEEVNVSISNLPAGLEGLRLLLLTDVHASAYMPPREVARVVGLARELEADLVFHTGDFLTSPGDPLAEAVAELSRVEGHLANFGCLGNHEIYAGVTELAAELFARRGVRILREENFELEINGAKLNLIGVDYQRHYGAGPEQWKKHFLVGVEKLVRPEALNILLSHNPNTFPRAAELGIELSLAGHTHGGQVQVEILHSRWSPPRIFTPFVSGLYDLPLASHELVPSAVEGSRATGLPAEALAKAGRALLYVSRGIGTIGAPIRLNAPPEITLLTLRRS